MESKQTLSIHKVPNWNLIGLIVYLFELIFGYFFIKYYVYIKKMPNSFPIAPNWLIISPN